MKLTVEVVEVVVSLLIAHHKLTVFHRINRLALPLWRP